ncbi:hypothetical protein BH09VER1_BH09VER1_31830 [soil metagenome]
MRWPSLAAAVAALILVVAVVAGMRRHAEGKLEADFDRLALANLKASRLGLTTDEMVLKREDWLAVYGSCELVYPQKNRIDHFFATKPTGFRVAPVGDRGVRSLVMAERFAALGERLRGKRLVVIITPEWFYSSDIGAETYNGNFSVEHALAALTSPTLDAELRKRLVMRMWDYPLSLKKSPFLEKLATAMVSDSNPDKIALPITRKLAGGYLGAQEELEPVVIARALRDSHRAHPELVFKAEPKEINWDQELKDSSAEFQEMSGSNPYGFRNTLWEKFLKKPDYYLVKMSDQDFSYRLSRTKEWEDYDLMLAILKQHGARPLLISLPLNGKFLADEGVSRNEWRKYYAAITNVADRYGFPVADFSKFEDDPKFFGYADPNPEGWIHINRAVNAYYHGKLGTEPGIL